MLEVSGRARPPHCTTNAIENLFQNETSVQNFFFTSFLPHCPLYSFIADVNVLCYHSSDDYLAHIYGEAYFRNSGSLCKIYHAQSGCRTSYFPQPSVSLFCNYATNAAHSFTYL